MKPVTTPFTKLNQLTNLKSIAALPLFASYSFNMMGTYFFTRYIYQFVFSIVALPFLIGENGKTHNNNVIFASYVTMMLTSLAHGVRRTTALLSPNANMEQWGSGLNANGHLFHLFCSAISLSIFPWLELPQAYKELSLPSHTLPMLQYSAIAATAASILLELGCKYLPNSKHRFTLFNVEPQNGDDEPLLNRPQTRAANV